MNTTNQAEILINTKEILTDEERKIVLEFDATLDSKYLNNIGQNRWLNINVYSEVEHEERQFRMELGF
jgi:hypothetical protein